MIYEVLKENTIILKTDMSIHICLEHTIAVSSIILENNLSQREIRNIVNQQQTSKPRLQVVIIIDPQPVMIVCRIPGSHLSDLFKKKFPHP